MRAFAHLQKESPGFTAARVTDPAYEDYSDFTLVVGGPLYQFYLRAKLARPPIELVLRRIASISLFCWIPLLVLTLVAALSAEWPSLCCSISESTQDSRPRFPF
jgi:hypothetical protein